MTDPVTTHPENHVLNLENQDGLFTCIEPALEAYGLDSDELKILRKRTSESQVIVFLLKNRSS